MSIPTDIPQIAALREAVEARTGHRPATHGDFIVLAQAIGRQLKEHISETTLERLWGYSTRGYENVSRRTLDVLSSFAGHTDWEHFCQGSSDSGFIGKADAMAADSLPEGARVRLGWQPDRTAVVRHLGGGNFVAEHCENSKLKEGMTFTCRQFCKGQAAYMELPDGLYVAGKKHGLITLEIL